MFDQNKYFCPNCGSKSVYVNILVSGWAMVNANTLECDPPEECDCSVSDVDGADEFSCLSCDHEW